MKKIFTLIVIITFIEIIIGCGISAKETTIANTSMRKDRLEMIKEKGVLTVVGPSKDTPFFFGNSETNEIRGLDVDIINEIARRLGIKKVEFENAIFADLVKRVSTDDSIDIAVGAIFITPENKKLVDFTKPLYKETDAVIVPKYSKINFLNDLKNGVIAVEKGSIFEGLGDKWKKDDLVKEVLALDSINEFFNAIVTGKVDAGLGDSIIINYHFAKEKKPDIRILKGYTPELDALIGIAVKKNDNSLLNALNKIISDMKVDGTLNSILVEYGLDKSNMIGN